MTRDDVRAETLLELTRTVVRLLEDWGLDTEEMSAALALPGRTGAATFHRYREGQEALPDTCRWPSIITRMTLVPLQ